MKFYNRENELNLLKQMENLSNTSAKMTFIVGRRRVGKTKLILEAFKNSKFLYLFVAKKNEQLLCEEYSKLIENLTGKKIIGRLTSFKDILDLADEIEKMGYKVYHREVKYSLEPNGYMYEIHIL